MLPSHYQMHFILYHSFIFTLKHRTLEEKIYPSTSTRHSNLAGGRSDRPPCDFTCTAPIFDRRPFPLLVHLPLNVLAESFARSFVVLVYPLVSLLRLGLGNVIPILAFHMHGLQCATHFLRTIAIGRHDPEHAYTNHVEKVVYILRAAWPFMQIFDSL